MARILNDRELAAVFSGDGQAYLCPKFPAFHDRYMQIMTGVDSDLRVISGQDASEDGSPV